jgi:hypothetical protein
MNLTLSDKDRIRNIFFFDEDQKFKEAKSENSRFAYYTSAETAKSIIDKKQIWMRNTNTMNDYSEVEHGFSCLNTAYKGEPGNHFNKALDACFSGLSEEVKSLFNEWLPTIRDETFITCLSEHLSSEDSHGRLSMWRAYGNQAGVAIVINGDVIVGESDVLHVHTSPVYYLKKEEFASKLMKITNNIMQDITFLQNLGRDAVKNIVFNVFRFALMCTKHPGFHEEREWRVIASPKMYPSEHLYQSVELIRGIPQVVLKINLVNHESQGLTGLALPELLDRIIIGPCEFPLVVFNAFRALLEEAKVPNASKKIIVSDIPLRNV